MKQINTFASGFSFNSNATLEAIDMNQLDCAVWDFMADFKKRDIEQIMEAMCFNGFPRKVVDKRLKALFAKKWFDRHGERGNTVQYVLKKHVKRPGKEVAAPMVESTISLDAPVKVLPVFSFQAPLVEPEVVEFAPAPAPEYQVELTDHVRVAIWKVMRDDGVYSMTDLAALLDHVTVSSLTYHVRQMEKLDMLEAVTVSVRTGKKVYSLKAGVDMPTNLPAYQPNYR